MNALPPRVKFIIYAQIGGVTRRRDGCEIRLIARGSSYIFEIYNITICAEQLIGSYIADRCAEDLVEVFANISDRPSNTQITYRVAYNLTITH